MKQLVRSFVLALVAMVVMGAFAGQAMAQPLGLDTTSTGFVYPTGVSSIHVNVGFLGNNCGTGGVPRDGYGSYDHTGRYHLGTDIQAKFGDPVYAIADGTVSLVNSSDSWGTTGGVNNVAIFIRHTRADGTSFVALYGHIKAGSTPVAGTTVNARQRVGTVGNWPLGSTGGEHLHFGIHPGPDMPPADVPNGYGYGRAFCSNWQNTYGWTDAMPYISAQPARTPAVPLVIMQSLDDVQDRVNRDTLSCVVPIGQTPNVDTIWNPAFELRRVAANLGGGQNTVFHTTWITDRRYRYTAYYSPTTGAWTGWQMAQDPKDIHALTDIAWLSLLISGFGPPTAATFGKNLGWDPSYELRTANAPYGGQNVTIYQATSTTDMWTRYLGYTNPTTGVWMGWYVAP